MPFEPLIQQANRTTTVLHITNMTPKRKEKYRYSLVPNNEGEDA
jgi:hypothetical protein